MKTIREKQEDKKKHKRKTLTWLRIGEWESNPMSEDVDNEGKIALIPLNTILTFRCNFSSVIGAVYINANKSSRRFLCVRL